MMLLVALNFRSLSKNTATVFILLVCSFVCCLTIWRIHSRLRACTTTTTTTTTTTAIPTTADTTTAKQHRVLQ